jgi:hypothetical protein
MKRVWVLQKMAKAAFTEIPPKMEEALKSGSDELVDLADSFRLLSIYVEYKLIMISFVETMGTVGLGTRVSMIYYETSDLQLTISRSLTRQPLRLTIPWQTLQCQLTRTILTWSNSKV